MVESHNIDWLSKEKIWKPICVVQYNKYMKGVDRADQYLSYFSMVHRTKKWTKRCAMFLINCALFNAFKVYKSVKPNSKYKHFLHQTAKYWIKDEDEEVMEEDQQPGTSVSHRRNYDPPQRISKDPKKHKLAKIVTGGLKAKPQKQCRVCSAHNKKSLTCFMCQYCQVPLHKGDCFFKYHTLQRY